MTQLSLMLKKSELSTHLRWKVEWTIHSGQLNWLQGANGVGKTTLLDELKCQWARLQPELELGFTEQSALTPFQDLTVAGVFDLLWDIAQERRLSSHWKQLPDWDDEGQALWGRRVSLLSGGENQWIKLLMMRSLRSQVWLLDEPFQFLDQRRYQQVRDWILQWLKQDRFLILTHHGELALESQKWFLTATPDGLGVREHR